MPQISVRSRLLLPRLVSARLLCSAAAAAATSTPSASTPPGETLSSSAAPKKPWSFFKIGAITAVTAAFTAALGTAGYATYAYTLEDIGKKRSELYKKTKDLAVGNDASAFEKVQSLLSTATLKVPLKAIEIYMDIRKEIEDQVQGFTEPSSDKLLPDLHPLEQHVFTLVLDLNETLVYSDWKRDRGWRTFKRPGVDAFLEHLAKFYEVVVYSDQLSMYVDPVIERLDQKGCIRYRLARNATKYVDGKHYRDLSKLNRDPSRILYVSGHALESSLQPENCVPIKPWKLENDDTTLVDILPFLEYVAVHRPQDIRPVLESYKGCDIPTEFIERSKEYQKRMQEQRQQRGGLWRR